MVFEAEAVFGDVAIGGVFVIQFANRHFFAVKNQNEIEVSLVFGNRVGAVSELEEYFVKWIASAVAFFDAQNKSRKISRLKT